MKKTLLIAVLIFSTQFVFSQNVSFEILKEKIEIDEFGAISIYVEVINNSEKDISILKPSTNSYQKRRYYNVEIICNEIPLWDVGMMPERIPYNVLDLLDVPSKSKKIILVNGNFVEGMLACNSSTFKIKLLYNANSLIENINNEKLNTNEIEIIKKLTPVKIESKLTEILMGK